MLLGIVTSTNSEQLRNAELPMELTPSGMVIEATQHALNALEPMAVTPVGITVFLQPEINVLEDVSIMALQLFLESYFVLLLATTMLSM